MKIILGGGGDEKASYESHRTFYNNLQREKKVLYIPIAILSEKYTPKGCLEWFLNAFKDFPLTNVEMITDLNDPLTKNLEIYDGIYIGGGNTYKLLKEFRDTGFDTLLSEYLRGGGTVYGGSAGAIVLGKSIETARYADTNNVKITNTTGLNLLKDYSVWCHYSELDNPNIQELLKEGFKIIAIDEKSAIFFNGEEFLPINTGVHIFGD